MSCTPTSPACPVAARWLTMPEPDCLGCRALHRYCRELVYTLLAVAEHLPAERQTAARAVAAKYPLNPLPEDVLDHLPEGELRDEQPTQNDG